MTEPDQPMSDEQIADLLAAVQRANAVFASEVERIADCGGVNQPTVDRLSRLTEQLRTGARARAWLSTVDPTMLLAGTAVWVQRQGRPEPSARDRAETRWAGRASEQSA